MDDYKYMVNPIQYEYVYHVCERLAPFMDDFESYIKPEKKNSIIFRCLIDALFDMDEFLDVLNRNSIIDTKNISLDDNLKGFKKEKLEVETDEEKIKKAFITFKYLFKADSLLDIDDKMPNSVITNFVSNNRNKGMNKYLNDYFSDFLTSDDITFKQFMFDFDCYCNDVLFKYLRDENQKINCMGINQALLAAVKETFDRRKHDMISLYKRQDFIKDFIKEIRSNECIIELCDFDYGSIPPVRGTDYGSISQDNFSVKELILFDKFVNNPDIANMNIDDFLYYLISNYYNETVLALNNLGINPQEFINAVNNVRFKNKKFELLDGSNSLKKQLEEKLKRISLIKEPSLDKSTSVSIFEYGNYELKSITDVTNEISYYATDNVVSDNVLLECINGVIPKLTIFDRLNSVTISEKIGNRIDDTKTNFNTVEDNLKKQILVYEYLIKAYELKIKFIDNLINKIDGALLEENVGLTNMALNKRKENLEFIKCSTDTMINQIKILAGNHINVLNMLYRTKETFFTVIEGQTLINASISQEKLALKNIRRIVDIYDSALSNDFESAFNMIGKLKKNGLDSNSLLQIETNINNIQSLYTPNAIDDKSVIQQDSESVKTLEKKNNNYSFDIINR